MTTKDFLFLNYSFVPNSTFIFQSFEKAGYSCDFVDEHTLREFRPTHKYKNVVLYLHEPHTIPITNHLIDNYFQDSFLIQHDDTDFEDVQVWSNRSPDLVMQREYTEQTKHPYSCPLYPFHFPVPTLYDGTSQEKIYDVVFVGTMTNQRRLPFIQHMVKLAQGPLKHLKWYLDVGPTKFPDPHPCGSPTQTYKQIVNSSKIGLHYHGNSYDALRPWELASTKTAIIMPKLRVKSTYDGYMPFKDYCMIDDDFQDLEEKIVYMLENDRYKDYAERAFENYNQNHTPEKCFDYYHNVVKKYANL